MGGRFPLPKLPKAIAAYFRADKKGSATVSRCFTEDAIVKDEGHTHKGRLAIKTWKETASARYSYTSEPIACETKDGKTIVTAHLTGDFPGSPVDLRYIVQLRGSKIASLEIIS